MWILLLRFIIPALLSGAALWGISTAVKGATYIAFLAGAVFFISRIAAFFGKIIDNLANSPNFILNLMVVGDIWVLIRDFVNIFFILILIVIAFATIFNRPQGYRASELLPKLIVAALLVNFSLVITRTVVELLYTPTPIFINALGGPNFTGKIADALKIQQFLSFRNLAIEALTNQLTQYIATGGLVYIIAGIIANIILVWVGLILLIRLPMLIGLAIVSPITWLAFSFPKIKSFWDDWWCKLLYWSLIPFFLFGVIYFSLLANKGLIAIKIDQVPLPLIGINLDQFIILTITATLLIGGLWWVNNFLSKTACLTGYNLANATLGKAREWFWGSAGWTAGKAAGGAQTLYRATGVPGAAEALRKRVQEEGPILGTRARETREARISDRLAAMTGLPSTFAKQRNLLDNAEKETKNLENRLKASTKAEADKIIADLKTSVAEKSKADKEIDAETLAAITTLAKRGELDKELFDNAAKQMEKLPLALTKIFSDWKEGKFGGITLDQFVQIMRDGKNPIEARRMMYSFAASDDGKRVAEKMNAEDFNTGVQIVGRNTKAGRDYFKFWGDFRPTYVANYRFENKETEYSKEDQEKIKTLQDAVKAQIEKASVKDFSDYLYKEWVDKEKMVGEEIGERFKAAFKEVLEEKEKKGLARKFVVELRRKLRREGKDKQFEELNKVVKDMGLEVKEEVIVESES